MTFSRLREHFGTAGLVVAIVALVAALGGGAYAASGGSGDGQASASAKGKQGPRGKTGKTGKTGPPGPAGPVGPAGPQGPVGPKGDAGAPGANGTNGTDGTGVTSEEFGPAGKDGKCVGTGGTKFVSASGPAYACNGEAGEPGVLHPGETLPSGATETGVWRFDNTPTKLTETEPGKYVLEPPSSQYVPISFPIPLSVADAEGITVISLKEGGPFSDPKCPGNVMDPQAEPGTLCIYVAAAAAATSETLFGPPAQVVQPDFTGPGVGPSGAFLKYEEIEAVGAYASGSFAITAP